MEITAGNGDAGMSQSFSNEMDFGTPFQSMSGVGMAQPVG
jgi:hypothetical protein